MNILFYSSNSNLFNPEEFLITYFPSRTSMWKQLEEEYPQHNFTVACQLPAILLADYDKEGLTQNNSSKVKFIELNSDLEETEIARVLADEKPDIGIACSFWISPYDWLGVRDAIIADQLKSMGIKTICTPSDTALLCFDKSQTKTFLQNHSFNSAPGVYVHHDLFFKTSRNFRHNVYKNAVLSQIKNLSYPVIIKDTTGSSSVGIDVLHTQGEVKDYLTSKRNNSDRLIEQYIEGQHFGLEIWGNAGSYTVTDPFVFSINRFGITSPKQSVKLGPVQEQENPALHIQELKNEMQRLASLLNLEGITQIDLIFSEGKWYVIEINPRLSGMTSTYCVSLNESPVSLLMKTSGIVNEEINFPAEKKCINFKMAALTEPQLQNLWNTEGVSFICQTVNMAAKQIREQGYTEIILSAQNFGELHEKFISLCQSFPELMENIFIENAEKLFEYVSGSPS